MEQNRVLDIIINLLVGIKNDNKLIGKSCNDEEILLNGCSYLLNQTIRQYQFPKNHYFVSKKAQELWNKISSDDIFNYVYRDTVTKDIEGVVVVDKFRGGEGTPYAKESIVKGDKFIYKDVFSDEHIVTVSDVIKELLDLSNFDYESVEKILNKIYICKMLKSEDRSIKNKKSRSMDYREVILSDYYDVGIRVNGIDYVSMAKERLQEAEEELNNLLKSAEDSISTDNTHSYYSQNSSPESHTGMDYTKYKFEGNIYGKNRLVLAIVKAYVRDNPTIVYSNLKTIFFDQLQGSTLGVIATPIEARQKRKDPERRYFLTEPIILKGGVKVVVCSQWGIANIYKFIERAKKLGYSIEEYKN